MLIKLANLVFDQNLYPRHHVDEYCVTDYTRAMQAGGEFPPIIVDKLSKRIVDGWKRAKAALKIYGDGGEIEAELRSYKTEADLLFDAIAANTIHGQRIERYDLQRCVILGDQFGLDSDKLAAAMRVTPEHIDAIREKLRTTRAGDIVANKQVGQHLPQVITMKNREGLKNAGGGNQVFFINQVINLIEHDLLNMDNERIVERLGVLYDLLRPLMKKAA
jgi:hypothetical protein